MDMKHTLLEVLGIGGVGPAGTLQRALVFEDEVWLSFHQGEVTDRTFVGKSHQTTCETGEVHNCA